MWVPLNIRPTEAVEENSEGLLTGIRKDIWKIVLLVFLYALLGVPIGLTGVIAKLYTNGGVANIELVMLFAPWALTWKLFWTPFLNYPIIHRLGRRISWMFAAIGQSIILLLLTLYTGYWQIEIGGALKVLLLSLMFTLIYFLVAIQTIEVHKWAFTMLQPSNLTYNGFFNSAGQNAGYYLVLFAWKLKEYCNKYLGTAFLKEEMNTLPRFQLISVLAFLVVTGLVAYFKRSTDEEPTAEDELKTQDLWKLAQTSQVQKLAGFLLLYIFITLLTTVGSSNQPEEISFMKIIMLGSVRIIIMLVECLTGPRLEDILKTAIHRRIILFCVLFFIIISVDLFHFSLTIPNLLVVFTNHFFYVIFLYWISQSQCLFELEDNETCAIFLTTLLRSADELYCYCLSAFISYTMQLRENST